MCVAPRTFEIERGERWEEITTSCGECWHCRTAKVNDYVGRGLAEAFTSDHTCALTLTYAEGHEGQPEKYVRKEDFQKFIRALRKRGHRLRYLVVSERGERKGRVHFHCLLFFRGQKPDWRHGKHAWDKAWPWGLIQADWNADDRALRYVLKYVLKNSNQKSYWKSSSLKPALGHDWFMLKADQAIAHGVMPISFIYLPPNASGKYRYRMSGATRRNYIHRIVEGLRAKGRCPLSISGEIVSAAVEHVDRWAVDREERAFFMSLKGQARENYLTEQITRLKQDLRPLCWTDQQAERYLNNLAIQLYDDTAHDFSLDGSEFF